MIWVFAQLCWAGVEITPPPAVGTESVIVVTGPDDQVQVGKTVTVVHRPELSGEHELAIGITDGRGRVRWTPESGGVAELRAGKETLPVTVAWSETPLSTGILLVLLGIAGLGALGYGLASSGRRAPSRARSDG